jgi:hypothetical protein
MFTLERSDEPYCGTLAEAAPVGAADGGACRANALFKSAVSFGPAFTPPALSWAIAVPTPSDNAVTAARIRVLVLVMVVLRYHVGAGLSADPGFAGN